MKTVNCEHWENGVCKMDYYGGRPSWGTCVHHCPVYLKVNGKKFEHEEPFDPTVGDTHELDVEEEHKNYMRQKMGRNRPQKKRHAGLGDTVKWVIEKVSFGKIKQKKGCGCKKRQSWLNRHFPYRLPKWFKKGT